MVLEGVSTDLLFVRVVAITLVLYAGQKSPNFSVSTVSKLTSFGSVVEID